jgi:hypothetical protein
MARVYGVLGVSCAEQFSMCVTAPMTEGRFDRDIEHGVY